MITPATRKVEKTVATKQLYHRAAGFSIVPKAKIEIVPHAPDMKGRPYVLAMCWSNKPSTAIVRKQKTTPHQMSLVGLF
jgi:hypothetical protein|tara:strand:+ start:368 stop:604 length:237 start_codon:yes stop_codon:yes gene_type:complete